MNYLNTSETILADYDLQFCKYPQLFIITGESGAGKTSACHLLIRQARQQGCPVAGLVSPPVYQSGIKVAIALSDVASGETRRLAWRRDRDLPENEAEVATRGWKFDPETVAWGNRILEELPTGPLLILDELGPLELQKQAGFTSGLRLLDDQRHQIACVVIRTACLASAVQRWPWAWVIRDLRKASAAGQP